MSSAALTPVPSIPVRDLEAQISPWPERVAALVISSDESHEEAARMLRDIKALRDEIEDKCRPVIQAAHSAHQAALAQKRELEADLVRANDALRQKMTAWREEQEKRAREQEALEAAIAREAQTKAEAEARELEAMGEHELAAVTREQAEIESAPPPVTAPKKVAGASYRTTWHAEVTDMNAFLAAVVEGRIPMGAVQVNQTLLNQQARSLKKELNWPGVRVFPRKSVATR